MTELSRTLGLSVSAISQGVGKGAKIADDLGVSLAKTLKLKGVITMYDHSDVYASMKREPKSASSHQLYISVGLDL